MSVDAKPDMNQVIEAALLLYSEWLDVNKLMRTPKSNDRRTHEQLVAEFRRRKGN